jgi:hypothetical protein
MSHWCAFTSYCEYHYGVYYKQSPTIPTTTYLTEQFPDWRQLPGTPPGILVFGSISYDKDELDEWLERLTRYRHLGGDLDDGIFL